MRPFHLKLNRSNAGWLLALLLSALLPALILFNTLPLVFRPLSIGLRFGHTLVLPALVLVMLGVFALRGSPGAQVSLAVVAAVFALSLAGQWAAGQSDTAILAGLFPWSDAGEYYRDALRLLEGWELSPRSSRRPLFPAFLAVLLALTGRNLTLTLAIVVLLAALAVYFCARQVRSAYGPLTAAVFFAVLFFYYRRYTGSTLSENSGLWFGALGLALILNGAAQKQFKTYLGGVLLLTLGLISRAGPFFILVGAAVWAGLHFARPAWPERIKKFALVLLVVLLGFAVNRLWFGVFGDPASILFSDFPIAMYGVADGGTGWTQIYKDHPDLFALPDDAQTAEITRLVLQKIQSEPLQLVRGMLAQYRFFFSDSWFSAYGYIGNEGGLSGQLLRVAMLALAGLGLLRLLLQRKDPLHQLALWLALGLLLSVPFVPPQDTNRVRAYAAGIPVLALLPGLGAALAAGALRLKILNRREAPGRAVPLRVYAVFCSLLLLAAPLILRAAVPVQSYSTSAAACEPGQTAVAVRLAQGTQVTIHPENVFFLDYLPDYHFGRYQQNLHSISEMDIIAEHEKVTPPVTLAVTIDLQTRDTIRIFAPPELLDGRQGLTTLCGVFRTDAAGKKTGYFDAAGLGK